MATSAETVGVGRVNRSAALVTSLAAGFIMGLLEVVIALSLISLIFFGEWAGHLPAASAIALVGAAVVLGGVALFSTIPGIVGSSQDTTTALLAVVSASIATQLDPATEGAFLTMVLAMAIGGIATGVVFFTLGALRLGDLIRYIPHPVIGGFLAGTGLLVAKGSLSVLTGLPLTLATIDDFFRGSTLLKWGAGAALVGLLLFLIGRTSHPLVIPATLAGTTGAFFAAVFASGNSIAQAEAGGWLIGPFPRTELWRPWSLDAWSGADWSVIAGQAGNLATLVFIGLIGMLLSATAAELTMGRDADLNRELMAAGGANAIGGLFAAIPGYHAVSISALGHRLGAKGRLAGLLAAGMCVAAMFLAPVVLARVPRFLLGGLLLFLGVGFVVEWLIQAWWRLPRMEFSIVALIATVIVTVGFLQGVALGVIMSIVVFVVSYSKTDVTKHELSGANFRSNVERPLPHIDLLRTHGDRIHILELHGYLFFGTAHRVLELVRRRLADEFRLPVATVVVEFRHVAGMDASAVTSVAKIHRLAREHGFVLVLTGVEDRLLQRLRRAGVEEDESLQVFEDLDRAVQWCEDRILAEVGALTAPNVAPPLLEDLPEVQPHLERLEIPAGHYLIRAGEMSGDVFFLQSGRLDAHLPEERGVARIRSMGPGTIVGEIGAYLRTPRTASVVAEEPCVVFRLALDDLERTSPATAAALHRMFAAVMARRLADNVRFIEALRR